ISREAYTGDGILVNSDFINGLSVPDAINRITAWLAENNLGREAVNYKLRDWVFSRQRYWGEPFPLIHLADGNVKLLEEFELPLELPSVTDYEPTGSGESPLANISSWINTSDPVTNLPAKRESNTMPQWAGSCWYYLRFLDAQNEKQAWSMDKEKYWMPVDLYVGGAEHAVLHLLYSRFWHKVLYDAGFVSSKEPFKKLLNQGMILGEDGEKMSKSRGNVINPDDVIKKYGADSMRLYEMFMGPLDRVKPWSTTGIEGVSRFLHKFWRLLVEEDGSVSEKIKDIEPHGELAKITHKTIDKVTTDIENLRFNTAIAALMEFRNYLGQAGVIPKKTAEIFTLLLSCLAPHICEEIWSLLGHKETLAYEPWPVADNSFIVEEKATVVVQINGKIRARLEMHKGLNQDTAVENAKAEENVKRFLDGKQVIKIVFVHDKLVNFVIK
ncbi:MAG: class I tRNA ligase family protein, partial [bacterium]